MIFENTISRGSIAVMEKMTAFTEERHKVLANNIANIDVVGYKMQDIAADKFANVLYSAAQSRKTRGTSASLQLKHNRNFSYNTRDHLQVKRIEIKNENILFHDNNNRFIEKEFVKMSKNSGKHRMVTEMLRQQYGLLQAAISGRV